MHVAALAFYPVKGCRAIACDEARLVASGIEYDRAWLVIDDHGVFVTQRTDPKLAIVETEVTATALVLGSPGQSLLEIPLAQRGMRRSVRIWNDRCDADDMGDEAAEWFTALLGRSVRLVRFSADAVRNSDPLYTSGDASPVRFSDGYAVLVTVKESLNALNAALEAPLPMTRFRPNIVLDGLDAFSEDAINSLQIGEVTLNLVKPCVRCSVTTVDQATGVQGVEPLPTLKKMRWNRSLHGVTFGMNAIVTASGVIHRGDDVLVTR